MRVSLIADTFSLGTGTGIARYNTELMKGLQIHGIDVKIISPKKPSIPLGDAVKHIVKIPYHIFTSRDVDVFHATSPVNSIYFPFVRKPRVVTYHDITSIVYSNGSQLHVRATAPYFYKLGMSADKVIAVSTQTKQELMDYLNFPPDKIEVINLGVDDRFTSIPMHDSGTFIIGYIGTMIARKRIDFLIRAFEIFLRKYPHCEAKLLIFGRKDSEYSNLVELTKYYGINDKVGFMGIIPDSELVNTYNLMDVFVMPSDWEGFGIPILEAQRCGIPVIVRGNAHIPEEVIKFCIKAYSEEDLADKIHELYLDGGLKNRVKHDGLKYSRCFTWGNTINQTIKIYEDILSSK